MKNKICIICLSNRGKRICRLRENLPVCPVCCAKNRTSDCEGCGYYSESKKYEKEKMLKNGSRFTFFDSEAEEKVDHALYQLEKGRLKGAEIEIQEVLSKYPEYHYSQYALGIVRLVQKQFDDAISCFDEAIRQFPEFAEAWFNRGVAYKETLEIRETIHSFQKAIEFGDPSEGYYLQAREFISGFEKNIKENNNGMSLSEYFESMDIFEKAYADMVKKDWENALSGFQQVLTYDPNHVQSYGNMGLCYGFIGNQEEAIFCLEKALQLDPQYAPAMNNLIAVEQLQEGERLPYKDFISVEHYKDKVERRSKRKPKWFGKIFNKD